MPDLDDPEVDRLRTSRRENLGPILSSSAAIMIALGVLAAARVERRQRIPDESSPNASIPAVIDTDETSDHSEQSRHYDVLTDHVALWLGVLAFAVTALKLLVVSHGNSQTALAILAINGWTAMPNLLISMLPTLVVVTAGLAILDLAERIREHDKVGRFSWVVVATCLLALVAGPRDLVTALGPTAGVLIGYSLIVRMLPRSLRRRFSSRKMRTGLETTSPGISPRVRDYLALSVLQVSAIGLTVAAASPKPWLPLERLTLTQSPSIDGYVLGTKSDRTAILIDGNRRIAWVSDDHIETRRVCRQEVGDRAFVMSLIWGASDDGPQCR